MQRRKTIDESIQNGYDFNIGAYISKGFELFKGNPGGYLGFTVVFIIISFITSVIPILGTLVGIGINPPLMVGIPMAAHKQENYSDIEFGNFFKGFDHFAQLIVANIITILIYIIISLPLIFMLGFTFISALASGDADTVMDSFDSFAGIGIWIILFILLFIYVGISLRWTNYLIVFHGYDAVSAIKTSWLLTNKKWFLHVGFVILCGLIMILGMFALLVGIIFALPVIFAADYAGFAYVTGLNRTNDDIDEIGSEPEFYSK